MFSNSPSSSQRGQLSCEPTWAFTVHRTFGISGGGSCRTAMGWATDNPLGQVGPVGPGATVFYNLRITDSTDSGAGQTTWRIINPRGRRAQHAEANSKIRRLGTTRSPTAPTLEHRRGSIWQPEEYADMQTRRHPTRVRVEAGGTHRLHPHCRGRRGCTDDAQILRPPRQGRHSRGCRAWAH